MSDVYEVTVSVWAPRAGLRAVEQTVRVIGGNAAWARQEGPREAMRAILREHGNIYCTARPLTVKRVEAES